jgi:superoxide dismutase, Cu-Zn family
MKKTKYNSKCKTPLENPCPEPVRTVVPVFAWWPEAHGTGMIATARLRGGPLAPGLVGTVLFKDVPGGTVVSVEVYGLPPYRPSQDGQPPIGPHGFHIHEFGNCTVGDPNNPFQATGGHWNPTNQPHGNHAGDFPVLFSNQGMARMSFFTDKFKVTDVIGKSLVIHQNPDDYRTQPAGASGKKLACGVISGWPDV